MHIHKFNQFLNVLFLLCGEYVFHGRICESKLGLNCSGQTNVRHVSDSPVQQPEPVKYCSCVSVIQS